MLGPPHPRQNSIANAIEYIVRRELRIITHSLKLSIEDLSVK
jgi:hypothetical protein